MMKIQTFCEVTFCQPPPSGRSIFSATRQIVTDISKQHRVFVFSAKQFKGSSVHLRRIPVGYVNTNTYSCGCRESLALTFLKNVVGLQLLDILVTKDVMNEGGQNWLQLGFLVYLN
jgi:hypothetical protein